MYSRVLFLSVLISLLVFSFGQEAEVQNTPSSIQNEVGASRKHRFFFYWGYNRANYSSSNIHFKGDGYNFTLNDVKAKDRQSKFDLAYALPQYITIPQYDYRLGYYLKNNWVLSLGFDHMKYVMVSEQDVTIDGHIDKAYDDEFDGQFNDAPFHIDPDFLMLEHTNGLNYINMHLDKNFILWDGGKSDFELQTAVGAGIGFMFPKSDVTLMNNDRNDQWHIAGYGLSAVGNLRITFKGLLFLEYNVKPGFIHMPSILTTANKSDRADQSFFFLQRMGVFGVNFRLGKKESANN